MLRRICSNPSCGKVIDGEPPINKEDPDACLLVNGEVALLYDDLCPDCVEQLLKAMRMFERGELDPPLTISAERAKDHSIRANVPALPSSAPYPDDGIRFSSEPTGDVAVAKPAEAEQPKAEKPTEAARPEKRELANQVVKQFPIPSRK